jgi:hypothetical protein
MKLLLLIIYVLTLDAGVIANIKLSLVDEGIVLKKKYKDGSIGGVTWKTGASTKSIIKLGYRWESLAASTTVSTYQDFKKVYAYKPYYTEYTASMEYAKNGLTVGVSHTCGHSVAKSVKEGLGDSIKGKSNNEFFIKYEF